MQMLLVKGTARAAAILLRAFIEIKREIASSYIVDTHASISCSIISCGKLLTRGSCKFYIIGFYVPGPLRNDLRGARDRNYLYFIIRAYSAES